MGLIRQSRGDAHWSKDFIEHLRTVHFFLIVVAITIIALSRAPNSHDLLVAQHQIRLINSQVDRMARKYTDIGRQITNFEDPQELTDQALSDGPEPWYGFKVKGRDYFLNFPGSYVVFSVCDDAVNDHKQTSHYLRYQQFATRLAVTVTISDFVSWWNDQNCSYQSELLIYDVAENLIQLGDGTITYEEHERAASDGTERDLLPKQFQYLLIAAEILDSDSEVKQLKFRSLSGAAGLDLKLYRLSYWVSNAPEVELYVRARLRSIGPRHSFFEHGRFRQISERELACRGDFAKCFAEQPRNGGQTYIPVNRSVRCD